MNEYYTWEELVELGCPNYLVIQYIFFTKKEINKMLLFDNIINLIEAME